MKEKKLALICDNCEKEMKESEAKEIKISEDGGKVKVCSDCFKSFYDKKGFNGKDELLDDFDDTGGLDDY